MDGKITISASTLDEAITKALIELQTTSEHLHYEVVQKESAGLLGIFGKKPCIIRAHVMSEAEEKAAAVKTAAPAPKTTVSEKPAPKREAAKTALESAKELSVEEAPKKAVKINEEAVKKAAKEFLNQVFGAMGMQVSIETAYNASDRELLVSMEGDDMGILIGKRGQTLDSLQYLVSLVVNKESDGYLRVKLDTENYRSRRKETLETLARNIAYKVKRTRRSVSLEPMNPYERRIIHAALQNDKYVVTRSEGEDPFRHVVISLKREAREGREYRGGRNRENREGGRGPREKKENSSADRADNADNQQA